MKTTSLCAMALAGTLLGCNSSSGGSISEIGPGAECANGGVAVTSGGHTQIICNGTDGMNGADGGNGAAGMNGADGGNGSDGFSTLILTTALPAGDAHCAHGGEEVQTGLDDGAGGGTASDGILQSGEVRMEWNGMEWNGMEWNGMEWNGMEWNGIRTSYLCSGANGGYNLGATAPPAGAAGSSVIRALGGDGVDGGAGSGGIIQAQLLNGTEGGNVAIFRTGAADPSFTFPALPTYDPGPRPAAISSDVTLGGYTEDLAAGALFLNGDGSLFVLTDPADGGAAPATSLTIAAGVIVNVTPSDPEATPGATCALQVNGPLVNSGELTTPPGQGGELYLTASNYFGAAGSTLANNGTDSSGASRSTGGVTQISGSNSGGIVLQAGTIWNRGAISANGGAGTSGGNAGGIQLVANGNGGVPLFNSGAISALGGVASDGIGGGGGQIELDGTGDLDNSGAISSTGGDGPAGGGTGGQIYLLAAQTNLGSLRNSGPVNSSGGDCTRLSQCVGGNGSAITLFGQNGILTSSATLTATGGAGGVGGNGGQVSVSTTDNGAAYSSGSNYQVPSGDLNLSGTIDVSGGRGWTGGNGGIVDVSLNPESQPAGQQVLLYGYSTCDASGGSGTQQGGEGGQILLSNAQYFPQVGSRGLEGPFGQPEPGGSVIDYADLFVRGGAGGAGSGGTGGGLTLQTGTETIFPDDDFENVFASAVLDASGGGGANGGSGATGGDDGNASITVVALTGAVLRGQTLARGGVGTGTAEGFGAGGGGGAIDAITVHGTLSDSALGDFSGGDGASAAGDAGGALLNAGLVDFSGQLTAKGGSGTTSTASAGSGGEVQLTSNGGSPTKITASVPGGISVAAGTPGGPQAARGSEGAVFIDAFNVTSTWTH